MLPSEVWPQQALVFRSKPAPVASLATKQLSQAAWQNGLLPTHRRRFRALQASFTASAASHLHSPSRGTLPHFNASHWPRQPPRVSRDNQQPDGADTESPVVLPAPSVSVTHCSPAIGADSSTPDAAAQSVSAATTNEKRHLASSTSIDVPAKALSPDVVGACAVSSGGPAVHLTAPLSTAAMPASPSSTGASATAQTSFMASSSAGTASPSPSQPTPLQANGPPTAGMAPQLPFSALGQVQLLLRPVYALFAMMAAMVASLGAAVRSLPGLASERHLKKLRDAAEEDPKNSTKLAAYLAELNKKGASGSQEVLSRIKRGDHPGGPAVVVEHLRALVQTGKLPEYGTEDGTSPGEDRKPLAQLLTEMLHQVSGEQPDAPLGSTRSRPLHITLESSGEAPSAPQKPTSPLQILWGLFSTVLLVVGLSFAWLVGSQTVRRLQLGGQAAAAGGVTTSAAPGAGGVMGGAPAIDPKEYKKDEVPEKSLRSFKDVKGCDEAKEELVEVVEFLRDPGRFTRLGAKLPKGVLLTGPPGTGKTLLARAVAGEAGVPFFYRSGSEFEELYVGVGSRRMRALFQAAKKKAPCIVFIDEIDAIGGNRKHWENHSRKTLNQLLVEMDGFESSDNVIVMAATNLAETLDPALTRPGRFDRQVTVPVPDIRGRGEILDYYLSDKPVAADIEREVLARQTQGFSGADIANLVNEAALMAAKQNTDVITGRQLDIAFDKILMGVERRSARRTDEGRRHTAYHESGHALVALHTPGASPIHKATIMHRGEALGMVTQVGREDEFSINRQQMQARILVAMGGTVAEELIFGRDGVTSGATSDLRSATSMARHMVMDCGLNDAVGPMYVHDEKHLSEDTRQQVDREVRQMLVDARETVKALLQDKIKDLHTLAGALIEHETLTLSEIKQVLNGSFSKPTSPPPTASNPNDVDDDDLLGHEDGDLIEPAGAGQVASPFVSTTRPERSRG